MFMIEIYYDCSKCNSKLCKTYYDINLQITNLSHFVIGGKPLRIYYDYVQNYAYQLRYFSPCTVQRVNPKYGS